MARRGVFNYTFDKNDANSKSYELSFGEIYSTTIKMPKRAKRKLTHSATEDITTTKATSDSKSASETKSASDKRDKRASSQGPEAKPRSRMAGEHSPVSRRRPHHREHRKDSIFSFRVFDQDKDNDGGYDSAIDEDSEPYYLKLLNKDKHEVG